MNYLILRNVTGEHSFAEAEEVLRSDGFHLLPANGDEVRIDGSLLSANDVAKIKDKLKSIGFLLASFMQQSWHYPSPKIDVLL
ncbi:MAG: hypothetical protein INR73_07705 [Williamsia sp.]|nr:hypothetical protein [Williamsia sp.]